MVVALFVFSTQTDRHRVITSFVPAWYIMRSNNYTYAELCGCQEWIVQGQSARPPLLVREGLA